MNVLVAALGRQEDIVDAFANHFNVYYYDILKSDSFRFNTDILKMAKEVKPEIIFLQIQTDGIISEQTAIELSKICKVVNWTGDMREPTPSWFAKIGKHIHLTCFTNMNDVNNLRSQGINAEYLQIGFPTKIFNKQNNPHKIDYDVVFMANNYGGFPLSKFRLEVATKLKKDYGDRFGLFGGNYSIPNNGQIGNQFTECETYQRSKIAINISHFNAPRYTSDRLFRAMGSGVFVLSHDYKEIEKEFTPGEHLDIFTDYEDLKSKINYYLANDGVREAIALKGYNHVHINHTWDNRINELLNKI